MTNEQLSGRCQSERLQCIEHSRLLLTDYSGSSFVGAALAWYDRLNQKCIMVYFHEKGNVSGISAAVHELLCNCGRGLF